MKKITFLLIISLIFLVNTNAKEKYTEYKFVGYESEKKENTDLEKYEPVKMNKFYKEVVTNSIYEDEYFTSEDYPYINRDDYIIEKSLTLNESDVMHSLNRINFGFEVDSVAFENISNEDINNVKIKYNGEELSNLEIVKKNSYTIFKFGKVLNSKDISIELTGINTIVRLQFNNNYINQISINRGNASKVIISYKEDAEYRDMLLKLGLNYNDHKLYVNYYETFKKLYLFYNMEKEYYMDSEETKIDGYTFNEEESYIMYKKYVREIIKDLSNTVNSKPLNSNVVNKEVVTFLANVKDNKSRDTFPIFDDTYEEASNKAKPVNSGENNNSFNRGKEVKLKKPIVYRKINSKDINNKIRFFPLLLFTLMLCIVLKIMSVKFKYKNAS